MITRFLYKKLQHFLQPNKVVVIHGPRRVGKTTLIQQFIESYSGRVKFVDGGQLKIHESLSSTSVSTLQEFVAGYDLFVLDEAQKVPNIGANLKLMVDHIPGIKIIVSGSASFELAGQIGEPLTGRKWTLNLFPLSIKELIKFRGVENTKEILHNDVLIYGGYPGVYDFPPDERSAYLEEVVDSYLFKDILELDNIKNSKKLRDLLTLLAFQIGNEVSLSELGGQLELNRNTVARYLDLLEKSFILVNIRGFSRNLRKEVTKTSRYYFYDIGVRNALINNFNPLHIRDDVGQLWENFIVMERLKKQHYEGPHANNYFWRTYDQQEIDLVEEREGKLFGYEIKWNPKRETKAPKSWHETYENSEFKCITNENYLDFI
ncbi:MAG: ATP-binding protein [Candidatus Peregrinibacteria bacterium]|nr:ATP-binding protein [Candidatus Peregrinibacteria bacterium]MDZ4244653.1 ATP-binding protein [Candidatus Gracilibacteria bacterium]